jgi:prevent-host-death family protein
METIGAFQAKNTLGSLLDHVEQGEQIVITRHGRPVARLVPNAEKGMSRPPKLLCNVFAIGPKTLGDSTGRI